MNDRKRKDFRKLKTSTYQPGKRNTDMKTNKYLPLETTRLLLRDLETSDWESVSFLRTDKTVNQYVRRPDAPTREKALEFIGKIRLQTANGESFYWCISLKNEPEMIGSISLWNFSVDRTTAEVGYDLKPTFQNQGIMSEALQAVLSFGFGKLELKKMEAFTERRNEPSKKLLLKNQFLLNLERKDKDNPENLIFEICHPAQTAI